MLELGDADGIEPRLPATVRRLATVVGDEVPILAVVAVLTVCSVTLIVLGPWLLGTATDIIVTGVTTGEFDFTALHERLRLIAGIYLVGWALGYAQAYLLTGAIQRSMQRLRQTVEAKLHRLPLAYVDGHPAATSSAGSPTTSTTSPRVSSRARARS